SADGWCSLATEIPQLQPNLSQVEAFAPAFLPLHKIENIAANFTVTAFVTCGIPEFPGIVTRHQNGVAAILHDDIFFALHVTTCTFFIVDFKTVKTLSYVNN